MFPYPAFRQELENMRYCLFVYHQISTDPQLYVLYGICVFQMLTHQSQPFYLLLLIVILKYYSDTAHYCILNFKGNNYQFFHDVLSCHRKPLHGENTPSPRRYVEQSITPRKETIKIHFLFINL